MRAVLVALSLAGLVWAGCVGCATGDDAVTHGGTFEFVSPGGKTEIFYDPPQRRGKLNDVSGPDLMDPQRTRSVDEFTGQVVVLNVWGQWCGPCRTEIDQLQRVYAATAPQGVAFLGIDVRDYERQAAQDFITDRKVTYPSIYDPEMRTMIAFGGHYPSSVIPVTLVLDRQHRVAAVFLREVLVEDLQPLVERLATEQDGQAGQGAQTGQTGQGAPSRRDGTAA